MYGAKIVLGAYEDGSSIKNISSQWGGDLTKELMWTFDIHYVTQNNSSFVQLFAMKCLFCTTVPSYVISPHKFLRIVQTLHGNGSDT